MAMPAASLPRSRRGRQTAVTPTCLRCQPTAPPATHERREAYRDTQNGACRAADVTCRPWARQPPPVQTLGAQQDGSVLLHTMPLQHPDVVSGVAKDHHFMDGRSMFSASFNVSPPGRRPTTLRLFK